MKMLNEMEMNLVSGGIPYMNSPIHKEDKEKERYKEWQEWVSQEKQKMEGLADIRIRAAENALKAAMRLNRQEEDIKEAMRANRETLGLD